MQQTAIIFYGPSGSGKGTQATKLQEYIRLRDPDQRVHLLSIGKRLRELVERDTYTSRHMKSIVGRGELVPLFYTIRLWSEWFDTHMTHENEIVLIDGIARQPAVAPILAEALAFYELMPAHIIYLDVSPEESRRRLLARARSDDTAEEIERRLAWFTEKVAPTIDALAAHDGIELHTIDGEQDVADVHASIVNALWET